MQLLDYMTQFLQASLYREDGPNTAICFLFTPAVSSSLIINTTRSLTSMIGIKVHTLNFSQTAVCIVCIGSHSLVCECVCCPGVGFDSSTITSSHCSGCEHSLLPTPTSGGYA